MILYFTQVKVFDLDESDFQNWEVSETFEEFGGWPDVWELKTEGPNGTCWKFIGMMATDSLKDFKEALEKKIHGKSWSISVIDTNGPEWEQVLEDPSFTEKWKAHLGVPRHDSSGGASVRSGA